MQRVGSYPRVLIDAAWPAQGWIRESVLLGAGVFLLAIAAQLQIRLPFSLVPVTGQTFAVLLLAALLGSRRGPAVVAIYLFLGGLGAPVFAGGTAGVARLVGPTAGYLVGFIAAAYGVGWLSERGWDRHPGSAAASMALGNVCIYAFGALWLAQFVGGEAVLRTGVAPFIVGDLLKIAFATLLLPAAWRLVGRAGLPPPSGGPSGPAGHGVG
ncbi:MAG: biotin transporter BioY [Anaerolineales bacterium]|nr:biotin transporter BioY [Anaerolineales bacterium]